MDMTYPEYLQFVDTHLTPGVLKAALERLEPKKLFENDALEEWRPLRHAGYTLITPLFGEERENIMTYVKLGDVQQLILRKLNPAYCMAAPISAFHQTVAGLVSGSHYEQQIAPRLDGFFIKQIDMELTRLPQLELIQMEIRGIAVLPGGFIVALLSTIDKWEYQRLISFRSQVYRSEALRNLGVAPEWPFIGQITLAYLQASLKPEEQNQLSEAVLKINHDHFITPLPFALSRAALYKFENDLHFFRAPHWPVYRLHHGLRC